MRARDGARRRRAAVWACNADVARGFLGGLSPLPRGAWTAQGYFNWHPVFMTMAFVVCGTEAALAYRFPPFSKSVNKAIHASVHTRGRARVPRPQGDVRDAGVLGRMNPYRHSWIGILGVTLYFANRDGRDRARARAGPRRARSAPRVAARALASPRSS